MKWRWGSDQSSEVRAQWHCGITSVTCRPRQDLTSQQPGSPNSCSEMKVFLSTHLPNRLPIPNSSGRGSAQTSHSGKLRLCVRVLLDAKSHFQLAFCWPFQKFAKGSFCPNVDSPSIPPPQCREQQQADNLNVFYSLAQTETSHNQMRVLQNEAGERHTQHLDNQRWSSTGMWALPTALLPLCLRRPAC